MKLLRRLLIVVLVLVILIAGAGFYARHASRQRPDWYAGVVAVMDPQARAESARRADNQMLKAVTWAAQNQGAEQRARTGAPASIDVDTHKPETAPDRKLKITFTEGELNALFLKWKDNPNVAWDQNYGKMISDPAVVIHDGALILAGLVKDFDTVASLHFRPAMTPEGKLDLHLERVMAGSLPMPQAVYEKYRQQGITKITGGLPREQEEAKIRTDGTANDAAIRATMGQLLLNVLNFKPADSTLFIESDLKRHRSVAVNVTNVAIKEKTIELTVEALSDAQRSEFLQRIKGTPSVAAAPGVRAK